MARWGPLWCASPVCAAIVRRVASRASSARPDLPASSCLGFPVAIPPRLCSRSDSVTGLVRVLSFPVVVTECQLGAWWSVGTLDSLTRMLIGSAWLVEPFSLHTCASPAAGTPASRPRAPLTTCWCEAFRKVFVELRARLASGCHQCAAISSAYRFDMFFTSNSLWRSWCRHCLLHSGTR